jgi:protein-S-isoprenylcysteine O-methyltransferase Ste14
VTGIVGVVIAFVLMLLSDLFKLRNKGRKGAMLLIAGMTLLVVSLAIAAFSGERFEVALLLRTLAFLVAGIALVMEVTALFLSLPARETYLLVEKMHLQDKGMYALCRHPAALCLPALLLSLAVGLGSGGLLRAGALASFLNFMYVWIQDRYIFPRTIPGYHDYQKRVPFLLPTPVSIKAAIATRKAKQG